MVTKELEQIKTFTGLTVKNVEDQVNKWLRENDYVILGRGTVVMGVNGDIAAPSQLVASLTIWYLA